MLGRNDSCTAHESGDRLIPGGGRKERREVVGKGKEILILQVEQWVSGLQSFDKMEDVVTAKSVPWG